ncbi:MAG: chemotaxis protein CheC [Candidatus Anammoxibacter sp.]
MIKLTDKQLDGLTEIVNIGVGCAASSLNEIIKSEIELKVPVIKIVSFEQIVNEDIGFAGENLSCVKMSFSGDCSGVANLILPNESAVNLVNVISDEQFKNVTMDDIKAQTLEEVGNILISGILGSIGNMLKKKFDVTLPVYIEGKIDFILNENDCKKECTVVLVKTTFKVKDLSIEGLIILVFMVDSFKTILCGIDNLYNKYKDA